MAKNAKKTKEGSSVVFAYEGEAYNRPIGRGIVINRAQAGGQKYLEDAIPEGYFRIKVVVTKTGLSEDEADKACTALCRGDNNG